MRKMLEIMTKEGFSDRVTEKAEVISRDLKKTKYRIDVLSELVKNMREDSRVAGRNNGF